MSCHKGVKMHTWTDEERAYLTEIVPGRSHREITEMMVDRFGDDFTLGRVKSAIKRYGLNTGRTGYFEKGHVPENKGKKWDEYMSPEAQARSRKTTFKPGEEPSSGKKRPVGSERVGKDGYIEVKFTDVGGEEGHRPSGGARCWKQKHRLIWEQHHGKIPKGHNIVFGDGDKQNFDIDNLVCVSKADMAVINQLGLKYYDAESLKAAVVVAKLTRGITKRQCEDRKCRKCGDVFSPRFIRQRTCDRCLGKRSKENGVDE